MVSVVSDSQSYTSVGLKESYCIVLLEANLCSFLIKSQVYSITRSLKPVLSEMRNSLICCSGRFGKKHFISNSE